MKAWRIENRKTRNYTETTLFINIRREILNSLGNIVNEEVLERVKKMDEGESITISEFVIKCFSVDKLK